MSFFPHFVARYIGSLRQIRGKGRRTRVLVLVLCAILFVLYLPQLAGETTYLTSFAATLVNPGNFHVVVPGRFYRSGEMDSHDLREIIRAHGIKTVIDLRIDGDSKPEERETVKEADAVYYHQPLIGSKANQQEEFRQLIELYDSVQTPVLVHCSTGTHRSGVASAIWLLTKENIDIEQAKNQLAWPYGYIHWERRLKSYFQGHQTIDAVVWEYEKAHKSLDISFRSWIKIVRDSVFTGQPCS